MFFVFDDERELKIERLYHAYRKLMYKVAFDILHDGLLSEDAVHEAFVRVMKNLHKIDEENCPRTRNFLVVISRNVAIDMKKKMSAECKYDDRIEARGESIENEVIIKDSVTRLAQIINTLEPIYRDVFLLRRVHKLSRREIAKILGLNIETVKKRLTRANEYIREKAKREGIL